MFNPRVLRPFEKYRWNKRDLSVIRTAAPFFIFPRIRGKKEMEVNQRRRSKPDTR